MIFFKKYKIEVAVLAIISVLFFLSRLYNIMSLPIFTDEAIYVRWSQIAKGDANWRFISLTDGKQPLFVWLTMTVMRFIKDPLLAGRLVSVGAGFFTLVGLFFLGREIFKNRWVGILSSALYLLFPMALVYDRMALYDSLVGTFAVWSLYFETLLVRRIRLDIALVLGMVLGGAVLTKSMGFFGVYLLPFSLILFDWKEKEKNRRLLRWVSLAFIATVLTYSYYSILRLSPFFHIINEKNAIFVFPFREWLSHPFTFFWGNLSVGQWNWLNTYLTWPILGLVVASFFLDKQFLRGKALLFIWFIIPFLLLALFGKVLYPRFIFFMVLFLLPLAAFSIFKIFAFIKNKWLFIISFLLLISLAIRADYFIFRDFSHAPIPASDLNQYNNDWPSGGGIKEAVDFFNNQAKNGKIYIATQGTFGLLPYALEIYLLDNPNIKIEGIWPIDDKIPQKVIEESKKNPTYFVFYQPCQPCDAVGVAPTTWRSINLVYQYRKFRNDRYFSIYLIKP